jgi:uncharacterized protein with NAD-binding domain and iron-sulfur cluster
MANGPRRNPRAAKKAGKRKAAKKAAAKKATRKTANKRAAAKKPAAKRPAKKATKRTPAKKATKRTARKATKKTPARKAAKKAAKKTPARKATKKTTKKAAAKKATRKVVRKAAKKAPAKKAAKKAVKKATKKGAAKKAAAKKAAAKKFTSTPWSRAPRPRVAVFGAGIAGLTAAHELAERGFVVTIYEPTADTRRRRADGGRKPNVRLGGLAATQYIEPGNLRAFDTTRRARPLTRAAAGEHGFRFFPAYYLHIWDTLRRIPLYDDNGDATTRTVYDNVSRVIAQAGTAPYGQQSLIIPREWPRSLAELAGSFQEISQLGYTPADLSTFFGRVARYLVTSPERRGDELEETSALHFLTGYDPATKLPAFQYSAPFMTQISNMPRILAAFDAKYGDARTNMSTYLQLNMMLDRYDTKADGVLNGPTTDAWFDPWYDHLRKLGVTFERATLISFVRSANGLRAVVSRSEGALARDAALTPGELEDAHEPNGERIQADYFVVATDAFRAELATTHLRRQQFREHRDLLPRDLFTDLSDEKSHDRQRIRCLSTLLGLDGFATIGPPDTGALGQNTAKRRNPLDVKTLGHMPWDRFQTLSGIQYFFDTEFQVLNGHVYYSSSDWRLSSINSTGLWADRPRLDRDGYASLMSVDIGDWQAKSTKTGKSALESTPDELAHEVWRQVTTELGRSLGQQNGVEFPEPRWYAIDTFIDYGRNGHPRHNGAPYLVPIMGDWKNRPGAYPWNPNGTSPVWIPDDDAVAVQKKLDVWQAGHGGYLVHFDKLVFAGTWCKTFTRMTSMESACEAGRHAVNAILDHYIYAATDDDRQDDPTPWRMPFGFVDQELSSPIRFPTPAGDYAFVFDCENREPSDARPTRLVDSDCWSQGLPHPWTMSGIDQAAIAAANVGPSGAYTNFYDPSWMIECVRQWRQVIETMSTPTGPPGQPDSSIPARARSRRTPLNAGLICKGPAYPSDPDQVLTTGQYISGDPIRARGRSGRRVTSKGHIRMEPAPNRGGGST